MNPCTPPTRERGDDDLSFMEQFRYINGRRYHNVENVSYFLPNDNEEADRQCMQHYLIRHIWNGNFSSPVMERLTSGHANVLDVGCGSGSWILDVSSTYPSSTFVGVDISNMWKNLKDTTSNAGFLVHNLVQGVPFPEGIMDFIHVRFMGHSFSESRRIKLINELIRVCKSGGWIEIMDVECVPTNVGPTTRLLVNSCDYLLTIPSLPLSSSYISSTSHSFSFSHPVIQFHKSKGCNIPLAEDLEGCLEHNDQVTDVRIEKKQTPLGNWGGKVGDIALLEFNHLFKAYKAFLAPYMNLDDEQYQQLIKEHSRQVNKYKTSFQTFRIYGRKSAPIQDKRSVKQLVEEIYSLIHPTIHPLDASDRVLVAIIKALIAIKNEPTNPRQLATCIQKYGFTTLGGSTPYATVSGHISTHFTRVRQKVVPRPILGKIHHPTLKNKINYYLLDPDNILRNLLTQHFPSPGVVSSSSSPYTITAPTTVHSQHQQPISPPTSPQSSNYQDSVVLIENPQQTSVVGSPCQSDEGSPSHHHRFHASPPINKRNDGFRTFTPDIAENVYSDRSTSQEQQLQQTMNNETLMYTGYNDHEMEITSTGSFDEMDPLISPSGKKRRASENGDRRDTTRPRNMPRPTPVFLTFPQYFLSNHNQQQTRNPCQPRVPLTPEIYLSNINGLEVFVTNVKVSGNENEVRLIRRVDTNCVDRWSLLSAGGRKPRNSDQRWITLEDAQSLAAKLDIEKSLGLFLDPRLYDYFDIDLDLPASSGACCGPLAGFAYWFQCVNPKKIFLG
ncbi:17738_t:CDS:2 [Acaulospora morrowiae]|uniref:17738_t:CDS:1 n=1 Tax=Acaulospora morrowiae TaxID=94023 RepID=A0A9N8Z9Z2_9GLOM|nr:17738_t:CDS:2 [Acaulospora morrowiae]